MKLLFRLFLLITVLALTQLSACSDSVELFDGEPEVIAEGFQFTEGPFWHPDGFLIFSDIPANTVYRWDPDSIEADVYIEPSGNSNGISSAPDGTILLAQHSGRVSEVNEDLTFSPIAEEYNGNRLNSPNDLAVRSDGMIYFTDPPFGVSDEDRELDFSGVFKLDETDSLTVIFDEFELPNGIAFSPDESYLYINDSRTGQILRFEVFEDGSIGNQNRFANVGQMTDMGGADGMKTDSSGRLYTTGPNGLIVFDERGIQIHQIRFDHQITNLAWGGPDLDQLFITSPNAVYRMQMNVTGW